MDSTCPASVNFDSLGIQALNTSIATPTLLDSSNNFTVLPSYEPNKSRNQTLTKTYKIGEQTFTAIIFSVLTFLSSTPIPLLPNRYNLPTTAGEYWPSDRSADLTSDQLNAIYSKMEGGAVPGSNPATKIINTPAELKLALTGNLAQKKVAVSYDLIYSLQYEFCFYAKLYRILIGDLITLQNATITPEFTTVKQTEEIRKVINALNAVNLRMRDIINISKVISDKQRQGLGQMNTEVNRFYDSIKANTTALQDQASELSSKDVESRLRNRMMEYSEEKNAYANNLLGLYGFANLIALGLLFYIYRS
jgi:hypothetical protein